MRARKAALLVAAVVAAAGCAAYFVGAAFLAEFSVRDAVLTNTDLLSEEYGARQAMPTQSEVDAVVLRLHNGSVSPVWIDAAGRPVDAWGTPFRAVRRGPDTIACESAGPDRVFDTSDDIRPDSK